MLVKAQLLGGRIVEMVSFFEQVELGYMWGNQDNVASKSLDMKIFSAGARPGEGIQTDILYQSTQFLAKTDKFKFQTHMPFYLGISVYTPSYESEVSS